MPPRLDDYESFERLVATLRDIEAIDETSSLYWHVRPSAKLPTLEFRVTDTFLRVEDAVTIAGLVRALTMTALGSSGDGRNGPPMAVLDTALWRASRYGLDGTLVDPQAAALRPAHEVIATLIHEVTPALHDAGDFQRVTEGIDRILTDGNGASRQRRALQGAAYDRTGWLSAIQSPGR
jgi:carboxylate-amine ligase